MTHLGYILDKMKSMFKVDVEIEDQKLYTVKLLQEKLKLKVNTKNNQVELDNLVTYTLDLNQVKKSLNSTKKYLVDQFLRTITQL